MFSAAAALRRVFMVPNVLERPQFLLAHRPTLPSLAPGAPSNILSQQHNLVTDAKASKSRLPRDHEITARSVCLVDARGQLQDPQPTSRLLNSFDPKTHTMVMVNEGEPGVPPTVKILEKKFLFQKEREADKKLRKSKSGTKGGKTLELNWNISEGDMKHRMKKMEEFLNKGLKVDVMLARKRKGGAKSAVPSVKDCEALIERIKVFALAVEGTKEYKVMEGKVPMILPKVEYLPGEDRPPPEKVKRGEVKMYFQGKFKMGKEKDGKQGGKGAKGAKGVEDDVDEDEEEDDEDKDDEEEEDGEEKVPKKVKPKKVEDKVSDGMRKFTPMRE